MGAGDDIPEVLARGSVSMSRRFPAEKLSAEDLSHYATIVLGIRAYDTQKDVVANNKKLLDFVSAGGNVCWCSTKTDTSNFNSGSFTPYPARP